MSLVIQRLGMCLEMILIRTGAGVAHPVSTDRTQCPVLK